MYQRRARLLDVLNSTAADLPLVGMCSLAYPG
jgi:hypothetical protein